MTELLSPPTGPAVTAVDLEPRLAEHRAELTGYCYRMLGSAFEAEDAVQDTLVRAWRGIGDFEGRSALRSWLYRIATNVCLTMLGGAQRRARPTDFGTPGAKGVRALYDEVCALPLPSSSVRAKA